MQDNFNRRLMSVQTKDSDPEVRRKEEHLESALIKM